jgi:hypothetical protein
VTSQDKISTGIRQILSQKGTINVEVSNSSSLDSYYLLYTAVLVSVYDKYATADLHLVSE